MLPSSGSFRPDGDNRSAPVWQCARFFSGLLGMFRCRQSGSRSCDAAADNHNIEVNLFFHDMTLPWFDRNGSCALCQDAPETQIVHLCIAQLQ